MTFEEIFNRASSELGIPQDLSLAASKWAQKQVEVPPDIFNGMPDNEAVALIKKMIVAKFVQNENMKYPNN